MSILAIAPMDGITNNAFRQISNKLRNLYGDKQNHKMMMWTEFMSVEGYIRHPKKLCHHILKNTSQTNVIAQIYGSDTTHLLQSAIDIDQKYPDFKGIELNIGCPSPKIYACESGVGMLRNRPHTSQIIKNISENIKLPFSIKTRTGLSEDDKKNQFEWILSIAKYCDIITVHGRTYKGGHSGPVDRQYIYDIKTALSDKPNIYGNNTKILGNGGIGDYQEGIDKINNLDGVMRGQSVMKNPFVITNHKPDIYELRLIILEHLDWYICDDIYMSMANSFDEGSKLLIQPDSQIYSQIISYLQNKTLNKYTYHADNMTDVNSGNRHSVVEFRKHLFWYISGLEGNKEFKQKVATIGNYYELVDQINMYFDKLGKI